MTTIQYPTLLKAKKQHRCYFCCNSINVGDSYIRAAYKADEFYVCKTHKSCSDIADKLKMYDDAWEGVSTDDFQENIKYEYQDIMSKQHNEIYESKGFIYPSFDKQLEFVINHYKQQENA